MLDYERGYGDVGYAERFIWLDDPFFEGKKPKDLCAIIHDGGCSVYLRDMLDAVKIPKSHEVIVMSVGPDHRVDVRGSIPQQLLTEVRRGIYQQVKAFIFDKKRGPQAHFAGCLRMNALGAGAPDLWSTNGISCPEKGNSHVYNQFRCRIASLFFTM
jgi:hypothetical protein